MAIPIHSIDYGLGFTISDNNKNLYIELNKNLKGNFRKQVLAHEMLHWNSRGWLDNFKIDFFDTFNFKKQRQLNKFCRKHKRAYLCNSPFFIENGKIIPNWYLVCVYGISLISLITLGVIIL